MFCQVFAKSAKFRTLSFMFMITLCGNMCLFEMSKGTKYLVPFQIMVFFFFSSRICRLIMIVCNVYGGLSDPAELVDAESWHLKIIKTKPEVFCRYKPCQKHRLGTVSN